METNYKWNIIYNKPQTQKDILNDIINYKHLDKATIKDYLTYKVPVHDAYLLRNMKQAIQQIKNYKNIMISGDYDVDGITATAIMYIGLKELSKIYNFNVDYILPLRQDGYGLSRNIVEQAKEKNIDLIITVDNGIAATDVVSYAQQCGIDVIITDHHKPKIDTTTGKFILPNCLIVDPQIDDYPFKYICGACVAFKFIEKFFEESSIPLNKYNSDLYDELLVLNAIATIADVMNLVDENRFYVGMGLQKLSTIKNIGLQELIKQADLTSISVDTIAYTIGPILNAAGRMATPYLALNLLLSEDVVHCAKLAKQLIDLNTKRREIQQQAIDNISEDTLKNNFIVIYDPSIQKGILGTIASAVANKYHKPCFVLSSNSAKSDDNIHLTGSGRTVQGYPILSFIQSSKDIVDGGGHEAACGITLKKENLEVLKERCNQHFTEWLNTNNKKINNLLTVLCELDFNLIDMNLANSLQLLEPFGVGNPKPLFVINNVEVKQANIIGTSKNTLKLTLKKDGKEIKAIGFNDILDLYQENMKNINLVCSIGLNEWPKNKFSLQLQIVDLQINK